MARGNQQAQTAAATGNTFANNLSSAAGNELNGLAPTLETQVTNPQGFNPTDLAKMRTGAMQTAGGSEAATVGQGALLGARTRNAGAPMAAIGQGVRNAGENLSKSALDIDLANQKEKEAQREEGEKGLETLYGTQVPGANQALGEVANAANANTNAENASWDWAKDILDPALQAAGSSAKLFKP